MARMVGIWRKIPAAAILAAALQEPRRREQWRSDHSAAFAETRRRIAAIQDDGAETPGS